MQNLSILFGMVFIVVGLWIFGVCYLKKAQVSGIAKEENLGYQHIALRA